MRRIALIGIAAVVLLLLIGVGYYLVTRNPQWVQAARAEVEVLLANELPTTFNESSSLRPSPAPAPTAEGPSAAPPAGVLRLASWNTLHLGWNNGKDLNKLAWVLTRYDVIALQEVMKTSGSRDPLAALKAVEERVESLTGAPWAYQATSDAIGRRTYREYYAVLYREDRVAFAGEAAVFPDPEDVFIREPFYASFRAGNFDFTLITIHAIGPGEETLDDEIAALRDVFAQVQGQSACEDDVILVGDFNTPAKSRDWSALRGLPTVVNLIPATTKTSIGTRGMSKSYDNIWLQERHTAYEFTGRAGAYPFFEDLYPNAENPYRIARKEVSDHVPVWAEFATDRPDDDGCGEI